jgi:hypothetical protein
MTVGHLACQESRALLTPTAQTGHFSFSFVYLTSSPNNPMAGKHPVSNADLSSLVCLPLIAGCQVHAQCLKTLGRGWNGQI